MVENEQNQENMYWFDKYLTYSDVKYGLFTIGPWRNYLPHPGIGAKNATEMTLIDLDDGRLFRCLMYYPKADSLDIQIRNELKPFFNKHFREIHSDMKLLTEVEYHQFIQGDIVIFFVDPMNNHRLYIKYIKRGSGEEIRTNAELMAKNKAIEYANKIKNN